MFRDVSGEQSKKGVQGSQLVGNKYSGVLKGRDSESQLHRGSVASGGIVPASKARGSQEGNGTQR